MDLVCCCSFKRVQFLYQGFFTPPRYLKYEPGKMIPNRHAFWFVGPDRTQGLSNLQVLVYEVSMQCRLPKEEDFAKYLEIISSVQGTQPVLHTLNLLDVMAEPDDRVRWRKREEKMEPATLIKAASTPAYQNLQCLHIGGSVIEPYIEHLVPLIKNQPNLHSLEIVFGTWKERFALPTEALQSIRAFVQRPNFQLLGLGGFNLPAAFFYETIQEFLSLSAAKKITLYLSESEITSTDITTITDPAAKEVCPGSELPLTPKSLSIKYLANKCPTLGSKYILPAMKNTALNLEVLDLSDCGFSDPEELLSTLAYHPNLTLEVLDISSNILPQTEACCKVLEDLLQNLSSVTEFYARECGLGKPSLLASFTKGLSTNSTMISIRTLGLSRNELSKCSNEVLVSLFISLCHLPHLSNLGLSYNGLLPIHTELFREAWRGACRTKLSVIGWRLAPPPITIQTWPPVEEPQDKQQNRSILRDTCWNVLL